MKKIGSSIIIIFLIENASAQCAMCKAVIENGNNTMGEGINSGITYLMIIPYILGAISVFAFFLYKKYRKKLKQN